MRDRDPFPKHCARCHDELRAHIMSKFNEDTICIPCADDEKLAPGFKAANEAEFQAVKGGNYNFPGVGLSAEDRAFLAGRRKLRTGEWKVKR